jgi:glyoxylase-like metal-dependent hydrolase (beta-lactamase superfamily II)
MLVDPHLDQLDRYIALVAERGMRVHYVVETHTHADHFSAARELAKRLDAKVVMHRLSAAPFVDVRVDDGETLIVGKLRVGILATPGHTEDAICLHVEDRVLTGDTLLIGGTGRTDLPSGDPEALYESLFGKLLKLDPALFVYPAHDSKGRSHSTIGTEIESNPRLQQRDRAAFVAMMKSLDLSMPTHLTEALRTNMSGGKTVGEMLAEAAAIVPFMSMAELRRRVESGASDIVVLDVREKDAYELGHIPGAR